MFLSTMGLLRHKGYIGSISLSIKDNCFYGKIEGIKDLVSYDGKNLVELRNNFIKVTDDYIKTLELVRNEI